MKGKFQIELCIAIIVALTFAAPFVHATTLEFGSLTNAGKSSIGNNTHPGYGDNVTSTSDTYGSYLEGTGFTPNITTNYSEGGIFGGNGMALWNGSSDGTVLGLTTDISTGYFSLIAANGYNVTLNSFDVGTFGNQSTTFDILDKNGNVLDTIAFQSNSTVSEPVNLTASQLTIEWLNWNTGINNVSFNQQAVTPANVPEPGVLGFLGSMMVGGLGLFFRRLRFA